jgi:hypothetical protein
VYSGIKLESISFALLIPDLFIRVDGLERFRCACFLADCANRSFWHSCTFLGSYGGVTGFI